MREEGHRDARHGEDVPAQEEGYFEVGRTQLRISLEDIYFLMGLPIIGVRVDPRPTLPSDMTMEDLVIHFCAGGVAGLAQKKTIFVSRIKDCLTWVVARLVTRFVGSYAPERIGGGMLLMVDRAISRI